MSKEKAELLRMYDYEGVTRREKIYNKQNLKSRSLRSLFGFSAGTDYFMRKKISFALKMGHFKPPQKIVEIGCMVGHYSFYMNERGFDVTGVDLSDESIRTAKLLRADLDISNARFHACDVEKLESVLPEAQYDGVFSFSVLRYLNDPSGAMRQIFRVLKPGGYAVCDFPNIKCPWFGGIKRFTGIAPHIHDNLYSREQIEDLFKKAGFVDVKSQVVMFSHKVIPAPAVPAFMMIDSVLENNPLSKDMAAIIMCRGRK